MKLNPYDTPEDIRKKAPPQERLRDHENKQWREKWVTAMFCEQFEWGDALIYSPDMDRGEDVFVRHDDKTYPFQITEMAPRDPQVVRILPQSKTNKNGLISCEVYGGLSSQTTALIKSLVQKKNQKNYSNQEKINLLIYLNPPGALFLDAEEDIDAVALSESVISSKFKTISVYVDGRVIFIKGDVCSLAQI